MLQLHWFKHSKTASLSSQPSPHPHRRLTKKKKKKKKKFTRKKMIQNLLFGVTYLLINFRFSGRVSKSQSQQN